MARMRIKQNAGCVPSLPSATSLLGTSPLEAEADGVRADEEGGWWRDDSWELWCGEGA